MSVKEGEILDIDVSNIEEIEGNVREMTDEEFNLLCQSIEDNGYVEPIQVVKYGDKYKVINGNHRFVALRDVFGVKKVKCVVIGENWDEDKFWLEVFRLNNIKGSWEVVSAGKKILELREKFKDKYSEAELKRKLGFSGTSLYDKVISKLTRGMPKELVEELKNRKNEIETIEDLSRVLHDIFRRHGQTVNQNYLVFTYGGSEHLLVKADSKLWSKIKLIEREVNTSGKDMCDVMTKLFTDDAILNAVGDKG